MSLKLPVEAQLTTRTILLVRVERVVRVASLLDNPFIHGNPNMSSCFGCIVGYQSFTIQTIISVIYSPKDLFLLPIKCRFDGSKTQQTSSLQLTTFTQCLLGTCYSRRSTDNCFCKLSCISARCFGLGRSEEKKILKKNYFIRPSESATFHS